MSNQSFYSSVTPAAVAYCRPGLLSGTVINTMTQSNLGRKGLLVKSRLHSITEGSQGRNLDAGTEAEKPPLLLWLAQLASLHNPGPPAQGGHRPQRARPFLIDSNQDNMPTGMSVGQSDEDSASVEILSWQVTQCHRQQPSMAQGARYGVPLWVYLHVGTM